jgi:hypothetical protein
MTTEEIQKIIDAIKILAVAQMSSSIYSQAHFNGYKTCTMLECTDEALNAFTHIEANV